MTISIEDYGKAIALDTPWDAPRAPGAPSDEVVTALAGHFAREAGLRPDRAAHPPLRLLRALLTQREARPVEDAVQANLDGVLQGLRTGAAVTEASGLPTVAARYPRSPYPAATRTSLWRGDMTTLAADVIVNAANAQMLGCFIPFHACIDNAIHWAAGPRLRADCARIMRCQGHEEPTGGAKATRAYNLPARFVLHTVGPIIHAPLTPADRTVLASCYRSCLDLAARLPGVRTLAFCGISTGVFGFPKRAAARVALDTVAAWLAAPGRPEMRVVFNVFSEENERVYAEALESLP